MSMCGEKENLQREIATKEEELFALTKVITDLEDRLEKLDEVDQHYIRPMTDEERQRSKEREAINHVHR
mgnify:CR=1 FL=1